MKHLYAPVIVHTAVFVVAFTLTTFLHELAHAVAAIAFGIPAKIFHSYVSYPDDMATPVQRAIIAASGPLFSAIQGTFAVFALRTKHLTPCFRLFWLWISIIGMVVFLGYIAIGPLVPYGDTGKVYAGLGLSRPVSIPLSVLALTGIGLLFRYFTRYFAGVIRLLHRDTGLSYHRLVLLFLGIPVVAGTVINVIVSLPAPTFISLVFPMIFPFMMIPTILRLYHSKWPPVELNDNSLAKMVYWPVLAMVLLVVFLRLLTSGVHLG